MDTERSLQQPLEGARNAFRLGLVKKLSQALQQGIAIETSFDSKKANGEELETFVCLKSEDGLTEGILSYTDEPVFFLDMPPRRRYFSLKLIDKDPGNETTVSTYWEPGPIDIIGGVYLTLPDNMEDWKVGDRVQFRSRIESNVEDTILREDAEALNIVTEALSGLSFDKVTTDQAFELFAKRSGAIRVVQSTISDKLLDLEQKQGIEGPEVNPPTTE